MLTMVKVPEPFRPLFEKAQEYVRRYFQERMEDPSQGTIEIFGERYILVRAASMSVDFFETVATLYGREGEEESRNIARQILFDVAHAIGREDARNFHRKMNLKDPIEKISVGPIQFSHSGWAFMDISPESNPSPGENFCLIYDHPYSFESAAWLASGKRSDFPVCVMNAGYSSGTDKEYIARRIQDVMEKGAATAEAELVNRSGERIPYFFTGVRMEKDGGLFLLGVGIDVSERRRVEEKLRRSEMNLNRAQEVAHVGSWHLDMTKNELIWSDETYRIFGVPVGTPLSYERFLEAIHPEDRVFVDHSWKAEPWEVRGSGEYPARGGYPGRASGVVCGSATGHSDSGESHQERR